MNWRSGLVALALLSVGFYSGYLATKNGFFAGNDKEIINPSQNNPDNTARESENTPHAWLNIDATLGDKTHNNLNTSVYLTADEENLAQQQASATPDYLWQDPNDIVAMFNELIGMSEPINNEEVGAFSRAIDQLRMALADSPTQLAILVEHMQTLSFDSKEFHYITAILQGLPDQKGYAALQRAALRLSLLDDSQSRQQFLHLVSNSQNGPENPEILTALVDIALYSDSPIDAKLEALDLVMPFQITNVEKEQILSRLNIMLDSNETDDPSALLNHALRFSNSEERQRMANRYIDNENEIELRYSILDGLHNGTVPRSTQMKETLFNIARNPEDPLSEQAKHALMYVFDITNEEYQQIKR